MDIDQFFKEFSVSTSETVPEALAYNSNTLDAIARASGKSFYVIDYHKRGFAYVSPSPLFLCGRKPEEVLALGYHFYEQVMPAEDLEMLLEINRKGFEQFHSISPEARIQLTITYDFRLIQPSRRLLMVNQKLTPIQLTPSGEIWLALCVVSLSSNSQPGNVFIHINGELHRFHYSFEGKRWHESGLITLSEREKEVLQLSAEGYSNEEVGNKLCIDINTVKFHKRKLYDKFNVKNIVEAITFAHNNWLL